MLSKGEIIKLSLGLHLFFARIMKEHGFFLETGFTIKDSGLMHQANEFQKAFDKILIEAISLSNGIVGAKILGSGEVISSFTLKAEMSSAYFTGVGINTNITQAEIGLKGGYGEIYTPELEEKVKVLNNKTINLVMNFMNFKDKLLSDVLSCDIFTRNYPTLLKHAIQEGKFYLSMVQKLQKGQEMSSTQVRVFWDQIMEDHANILGILLDPSEKQLINKVKSYQEEQGQSLAETVLATRKIRDFKEEIAQGILECKIQSVMIPLLADHILREANHYLRILEDI